MPDLATIGTGVKVLGGLKGLFGGSGPGPRKQSYAQLKGAFQAADEFGLHRLAVAGSPAGYSPVPSRAAEGLMAAGDALTDEANRRSSAKLEDKQGKLLDAQIQEAQSRTILNNANAKRALAGPQPGLGGPTLAGGNAFDRLANDGERAISREPERDMPSSQTVTLGNVGTARGPNPEAFEVGLSELIAGGLIYGPQWLYHFLDKMPDRRGTKPTGPANRDRHGYVKSPRAGSG